MPTQPALLLQRLAEHKQLVVLGLLNHRRHHAHAAQHMPHTCEPLARRGCSAHTHGESLRSLCRGEAWPSGATMPKSPIPRGASRTRLRRGVWGAPSQRPGGQRLQLRVAERLAAFSGALRDHDDPGHEHERDERSARSRAPRHMPSSRILCAASSLAKSQWQARGQFRLFCFRNTAPPVSPTSFHMYLIFGSQRGLKCGRSLLARSFAGCSNSGPKRRILGPALQQLGRDLPQGCQLREASLRSASGVRRGAVSSPGRVCVCVLRSWRRNLSSGRGSGRSLVRRRRSVQGCRRFLGPCCFERDSSSIGLHHKHRRWWHRASSQTPSPKRPNDPPSGIWAGRLPVDTHRVPGPGVGLAHQTHSDAVHPSLSGCLSRSSPCYRGVGCCCLQAHVVRSHRP